MTTSKCDCGHTTNEHRLDGQVNECGIKDCKCFGLSIPIE